MNPNAREHCTERRLLARCSRRRLLQEAAALGAAASLALVISPLQRLQAAAPPLRIGVCGPFSGPAQRTGHAMQQGILMALADARAAGELPLVIDGVPRELQISWIDSRSNPADAVRAVTDAITRDGIELLLGGWHSAVALALMQAEAPFRIVHLGHLGESQYIADELNRDPDRYRGWFKGWPSPPKLAALYGEPLQYFQSQGLWQPANQRAAVIVEDSAFGHSWGDALLGSLRQAGFEPLPYDLAALDETEFRPLLRRYKAARVSLVAMTSTGNVAVTNFIRQFRQLEIRALLLGHGLRWFSDWYRLTGKASDYLISMDSAMPIALWQQWWIRQFKARYNEAPSIAAAGFHYDYTRLAVQALNAAGTLAFEPLVRTIRQTDYKGIWNRYRFATGPGPQALAANEVMTGPFMEGFYFPMAQLFGGEAKIIWPLRYASQRFRSPPWL